MQWSLRVLNPWLAMLVMMMMIFHVIWLNLLSRLLGYRKVPLTVGRVIDLEKEILPVATERLRITFFKNGICCLLLCMCICETMFTYLLYLCLPERFPAESQFIIIEILI